MNLDNTPEQSQLGKASAYVDQYDASLLFPIPRAGKRAEIGITGAPPFSAPGTGVCRARPVIGDDRHGASAPAVANS